MPAKKTTILAADDDPQLLRLITRNLQLEGYDVLAASDGQQALELIENNSPDLVLLDVMMPRMDGFTVCYRVREFSSVPIIIITARGRIKTKFVALIWARTIISRSRSVWMNCWPVCGRLYGVRNSLPGNILRVCEQQPRQAV